jgi:hypothetical protein
MTLPLRIELAMTLKAEFPKVWLETDPDGEGPAVVEAVSGRNILIWFVGASGLRPIPVDC